MKKKNLPKVKRISTRGLLVHGALGRSTDEFLKIVRMIHGDRYGFQRVVYSGYKTPVELVCPEHGPFFITPDSLFRCHGCPACSFESRKRKRTKPYKQFLAEVHALYGKKYTYDETTYRNSRVKIKVTCPSHGEFWQPPEELLNGHGCPQCGKHKPMNNGRFFREAKEIHGDKYDYSKVVEITGIDQFITIICPKHGEFIQQVNCHIKNRHGCPQCGFEYVREKIRLPFAEFLKRARKVHGKKYQYEEASYVDTHTPIPVTCPVHGVFVMVPKNHISQRQGCPKCGHEKAIKKMRLPFAEFLKRARKVHGKKYEYDKASYTSFTTELTIICPEHGPFRLKGTKHINGHGCPVCVRE
jgi:ssDNA-binding Zn-finger/Zn-ribbon topoisomerase 1